MGSRFTRTKALIATGAIAMASGAVLLGTTGVAGAASASDPTRADFHSGNVVSCSQVGFGDSKTAFASGTNGINVDGIVGTTTGGTTANIATPLPAGIVIQAVVMKGGPAYNVYSDGSGSVPANHTPLGVVVGVNDDGLASPQNYISPLNGGGNIPTISHWFICYTGGDTPPPPPGPAGILVTKAITAEPPAGVIKTDTKATLECDDLTNVELTLPANGGDAVEGVVEVDPGSNCWVTESGFITGVTYTVSPPEAQGPMASGLTDGVNVPADTLEDPIVVTVSNNYSAVSAGGAAADPIVVTPAFTG